ncbi:ribosome-associated ATPase/putative transporter RbbA [Marivita sp. S0852]|uniref:ribosome-associated ATPase/putative transporter RbbA n=1 Tax=Marivita sp. S0852 TaxID=3373893 RepID=UPI00398223A8
MSESESPVVTVRNLCHSYGETVAVDDISLKLAPGRLVGLFGPDGVGKSTLMGLIAGARKMQQGEIEVLGGPMRKAAHRNAVFPRIAYMPQGLGQNLYMSLSVRENLEFFGRLFGQSASERDARIDRLLKATRLDPFADRIAGKLSGGMKQKLGLCCALIHDPDLLILDEPTTGVDPLSRRQFWGLINDIRESRSDMSVLVSTAYMDEAEDFDHLHAMHAGRILSSGSAEELREETDTNTLEAAFTALLPEDERGEEVDLEIPPLEDNKRDIAIEASGLTRRFGDFTAVDDVSFKIEQGEIFGFIGSNGSGKTTTMKMLTGLLPASEGSVSLFGHKVDASDIKTRQRVGYMTQSFSLYSELSPRQNLRLHARLFRLDPGEIEDRIDDLLDQFGLTSHAADPAGELPLGLRQRLSLAAAIIHSPELLILDEPTSGVDPAGRDAFWQILSDLSREDGVTIFISTHFMNEAALCDRISLMHKGQVLEVGTPSDIADDKGNGDLEEAFIAHIKAADEDAAAEGSGADLNDDETEQERSTAGGAFLRRLLAYTRRETFEVMRDPIRLTFAFGGSIILMFLFAYGISMDVEDMAFAVFDQDRSPESRAYLETYRGSQYFEEMPPVDSREALVNRLRSGDATLILDIPQGFGKALREGRAADVSAWIDGANTQRASTIEGYVQGGHSNYLAAQAETARSTAPTDQGLSIQTRFRYNPTVDSIYAIAPAVPAILLLMFPAILMAISVAREREIGTITNFHVTPTRRFEFLVGKQLPYIAIGLINFVIMTVMAVYLFGVPFKGSLPVLAAGALVYVMASTSYGMLVSVFTRTQVAAVFATTVISMMPTVIFSGMLQPVSTLEGGAWLIGTAWPTHYYMHMSVGTFTKGLGLSSVGTDIAWIALFIPVFLIPALLLLKKQAQ